MNYHAHYTEFGRDHADPHPTAEDALHYLADLEADPTRMAAAQGVTDADGRRVHTRIDVLNAAR